MKLLIRFSDSYAALEKAYANGLHKDTKIKTSSPWIIFNKIKNTQYLESKLSTEKIKKLQASVYPFTLSLFKLLKNSKHKENSIIAAQNGVYFMRLLKKAACLNNSDKHKKNLIIKLKTKNKIINNRINPKWEELFTNKDSKFCELDIDHPYEKLFEKKGESYFELLRTYCLSNIKYFLYKKFHKILIKKSEKKVLIFREDHLLREICVSLFNKGVQPIFFRNENIKEKKFSEKKFLEIRKVLEPSIIRFSKIWVCKNFLDEIVNFYFKELKNNLDIKFSYNIFFEDYLNKLNGEYFGISSYPAYPHTMALADELNKKKKYLVSTQHGVNREINETFEETCSTMENTVADILLVKNHEGKKISDLNPFSKGKTFVVGTPSQMKKRKISLFKKKEIFYISTRISSANINAINGFLTDYGRVLQEYYLVKKVLAKVNKKIIFKTYPALDYYIDKDPVHEEVNKNKNLFLLKTPKDLQSFIPNINLIITARATSTISWCLLSGLPIIFINYPNQYMVKKEIYRDFSKAFIFFDAGSKNFYSDLKKYLSKSIEEMITDWETKKECRERFISRYISSFNDNNSGKRGADIIFKNIFVGVKK